MQGTIISDYQKRKLQVDFIEMTLTQNTTDGPISYKGKGYMQQTAEDALKFKLYTESVQNNSFADSFNRSAEVQSGTIYSDASYYTLSATAADGSLWTTERVLTQCDWSFGKYEKYPVVHGDLSSCRRGTCHAGTRLLTLHFFEEADIPCALDAAQFKLDDYDFVVRKTDESFSVRVESQIEFPEHFEIRVEEALRFLLAQSVATRVMVRSGCLDLYSPSVRSKRTALMPPLVRGPIEQSWALFSNYLRYVTRETKSSSWHPCSGYLHNALEASANSVDAWAIGLSVAVEGLANLLPFERETTESNKLIDLQKYISNQVSTSADFLEFSDRVTGIMSGLTTIRAVDRMISIAKYGHADLQHINAWKKLRNRGVHPSTAGRDDTSSRDFQKLIDQLHSVNVLLSHLVFHLIDHRGLYTDYSTKGFPLKGYPSD